jgi:hypothetical protein
LVVEPRHPYSHWSGSFVIFGNIFTPVLSEQRGSAASHVGEPFWEYIFIAKNKIVRVKSLFI